MRQVFCRQHVNENIFSSQNFRVVLFLFSERALDVPFLCVIEFFDPTRVLFCRQVYEGDATDTGSLAAVLQSAILKNIGVTIKAKRWQVIYLILGNENKLLRVIFFLGK